MGDFGEGFFPPLSEKINRLCNFIFKVLGGYKNFHLFMEKSMKRIRALYKNEGEQ